MKNQSPRVRNRLAIKLAQYTVLMAFIIGFFLSALHVLEDYSTQGSRLDQTVIDILDASKPPAARAVHTLDQALAQEVVNGLMKYPFISKVQIKDELGEVLAEQEATQQKTKTQWLTEVISAKYKDYTLALRAPGFASLEPGSLKIVVDQDLALQPFFERASTVLVSGIIRNILLAVFLIALFHVFLTKPLALLAKQFAEFRLEESEGKYLEVPEQHKGTELGQLSDVGNEFIHTAQKLLNDKKSSNLALRQSESLLKQVINQAPQLIVALNSKGQVLFCNQQVAEFYNVSVESLVGVAISDFHPFQDEVERMHAIRRSVEANNAPVDITEFSWSRENSEQLHFSIHASPFEYFSEPATLVVATDITSQKVVQDHISHIANHDNLTGLPNRVLLNDRLSRSILSCERNGVYNALLFIDLDHFKTINDSLGHGIGDLLLKEVAEILKGQVRANDTVARLGGDEFVILLEFLHDNQERIKTDVQIICDKLLEILSQPIDIKQHKLRIGASIGVVIFPIEGKDIDDLMRFADTAMYHAKENGRNGYAFYHRSMSLAVEKQQHMENELHRALEQEEFRIHYQPLVNVTGAIVGFEALIRWQHPEKGLMPPIEFIPSLETSGMIVPVSNWLLAKCSRQIETWKAEGFWQDGWYTSINISPLQFYQADMVITLQQLIVGGGANLSDICLEITETVAVENIEFAKSRLQKIRKLGITIALDDFGTGYSSLSYLKNLPIDIVKIDRSFIQELDAHNNSRSIVEAVASIAKAYNLVVLAEGIETKEQLEIAHDIGCHVFQGFYIERPQAAERLQNEYLSKGV